MPLYEYQCSKCGHRSERIQKFSDPPIEICPQCDGPVSRLLSSPALQFKGSGWYVTDYARKDSGGQEGKKGKEKEPAAEEKPKVKAKEEKAKETSATKT